MLQEMTSTQVAGECYRAGQGEGARKRPEGKIEAGYVGQILARLWEAKFTAVTCL